MPEAVRLDVSTGVGTTWIDLTRKLRDAVRASRVKDGLAVVWCPHTTAGLLVQENTDPELRDDITRALDRLVPREGGYRHAEGNAHAHLRSLLLDTSVTLLVEAGRPVLGTWQALYLVDFDGPRSRQVLVKVVPSAPALPEATP